MAGPTPPPDRSRSLIGLLVAAFALAGLGIAGGSGIARALPPPTVTWPFEGAPTACRVDDRLTPHRRPEDWARTLLDPEFALAPGDRPTDLVPLSDHGVDGAGSLRSFVLPDLAAMANDARAAGSPFEVISAHRSYADQARTFDSLEAASGRDEALRSTARPGHSEHQLGTTIDIARSEDAEAWLAANAWRYGFVMSYPPEHSPGTTCYKPEPWHFRYMGRDAASSVFASGLSLRAWLWQLQDD